EPEERAAGRHQGDRHLRQGQGAQRRDAPQSGDRRHTGRLPARAWRREVGRTARPAPAWRRPAVRSVDESMDAVRLRPPAPSPPGVPYLPPEAPLAMPVQSLREGARASRLPIATGSIAARRAFVFGIALALSILAAYQMYLVLAVGGVTVLEWVILTLFVIL